ncbi:MAG: sugar phosphate isomerase/epimerase family protein [Candidatus Hodarchaeota archaeon]
MATYSLRMEIGKIGMKGVADFLEELGIKFVEINNTLTKSKKLKENAELFKKRGITPVLLTIDGNNFFVPSGDEKGHKKQMEFMKPWLDAAKEAGISIVRANMGHGVDLWPAPPRDMYDDEEEYQEDMEEYNGEFDRIMRDIVETFKPIQEYAESLGITFTFENHGGPSSNVDFQVKFKEHFPSDKMGFLLDTGNYKPKDEVYENIGKLGDSIKIIHAKTYDFDENGEETQLDFKRIIAELKEVGYDGYYSIEFEGEMNAREGVKKTLALLKKYLA